MAERYISHGNTFDGDGTTIAAAASDGAVGAWNDLRAIMLAAPTYGTLSAGDTVHIRTKISGTDVSVDMATTGTLDCYDVGSATAPVHWKADDGTKWSGDDGVLTMNVLGNLYVLLLGSYAIYDGNGLRWVINSTGTTAHNQGWLQITYSILVGIKTTYTNPSGNIGSIYSSISTFYDTYFDCRRRYASGYNTSLSISGQGISSLVNSEFHVDDLYKSDISYHLITVLGGTYGEGLYVFGGKMSNIDSGKEVFEPMVPIMHLYSSKTGMFVKGFNYNTAREGEYINDGDGTDGNLYRSEDINGIPHDFIFEDTQGYISWQRGKNYPVLNALLPDNTSWSIKNFAGFDISQSHFMEVCRTTKYYNLTTAKKKITMNFLVKDVFTNMKKEDWFIIVVYRDDTTGKFITQVSPIDSTALETSSAGWIPVVSGNIVYGENTYNAYKIVLETTNDIKQNTLVMCTLMTTRKAPSTVDYNFADPDFVIEAI